MEEKVFLYKYTLLEYLYISTVAGREAFPYTYLCTKFSICTLPKKHK